MLLLPQLLLIFAFEVQELKQFHHVRVLCAVSAAAAAAAVVAAVVFSWTSCNAVERACFQLEYSRAGDSYSVSPFPVRLQTEALTRLGFIHSLSLLLLLLLLPLLLLLLPLLPLLPLLMLPPFLSLIITATLVGTAVACELLRVVALAVIDDAVGMFGLFALFAMFLLLLLHLLLLFLIVAVCGCYCRWYCWCC